MNFKMWFGKSTDTYIPENLFSMREETYANTVRVNLICKAILVCLFLLIARIGTADLVGFTGITYDGHSVPIDTRRSRER